MFHNTFCIILKAIIVLEWFQQTNCLWRYLVHTFLSYFELKSNFYYAIFMKKDKKIKFFMKSCWHFFVFSCRWNSKTLKCGGILHFRKHSSLCNCFWKRTMFFIFSFFHFLCNLRISTGFQSMTKNKIFWNLQCISFINLT